jgi:hypothetical protein
VVWKELKADHKISNKLKRKSMREIQTSTGAVARRVPDELIPLAGCTVSSKMAEG